MKLTHGLLYQIHAVHIQIRYITNINQVLAVGKSHLSHAHTSYFQKSGKTLTEFPSLGAIGSAPRKTYPSHWCLSFVAVSVSILLTLR